MGTNQLAAELDTDLRAAVPLLTRTIRLALFPIWAGNAVDATIAGGFAHASQLLRTMTAAWEADRPTGLGALHRSLTDHALTNLYLQTGGERAYEKLLRSDHVQRRQLAKLAGEDPEQFAPWDKPWFPRPPGADPDEPKDPRTESLGMAEMVNAINAGLDAKRADNPAKKVVKEMYQVWFRSESHFTTHASLPSYTRYIEWQDGRGWHINAEMDEPDIPPVVRIATAGSLVRTMAYSYTGNRMPQALPMLDPVLRRWAELRGKATIVYADMEKDLPPPFGTKGT